MMLGAKRAVLVSLRNIFQISLSSAGDEPQPNRGVSCSLLLLSAMSYKLSPICSPATR